MKIKTISLYLTVLLLWVSALPSYLGNLSAQDAARGDQLINRRVLILDFINVSNASEYSYLEGSIPETFLDPLSRTKSFELLLRTTWAKYVMQQRFNREDAYKEETAIEVGKLAGADVVVIGQFVAATDHVQFFAKAIEVSSGRVMVAHNSAAPLDNDLFNAIENMANQLSTEMKNKMPPLPQKVIIEQRIKYVNNANESNKEIIRRAQMEAKAEKWRAMEKSQAERFRLMEADQAAKWRMMESPTVGYKEHDAMISASYWGQPMGVRLIGNMMIGMFSAATMGVGTGLGLGFTTIGPDYITTGVSGSVGAVLGIGAGILVSLLDNSHMNEPIIGNKLLLNSWLWYGFGGLVGAAIGTGFGLLGNLTVLTFDKVAIMNGFGAGSLVGLGFGVFLTFLPSLNLLPQEKLKNLIFDINPLQSRLGYRAQF